MNVVWAVSAEGVPGLDLSEAVALTPGGGRMGSLAGGAFDSFLVDLASMSMGRLVDVEVGEVEVHVGVVRALHDHRDRAGDDVPRR